MVFQFTALDAEVGTGKVIDHYAVGLAQVYITSTGRYLIREPQLSPKEQEFYSRLEKRMQKLGLGEWPKTEEEREHYVGSCIWKEAQRERKIGMVPESFDRIGYYVRRNLACYGLLDVPIRDEDVEQVFVEGYGTEVGLTHRRYLEFGILDTNVVLGSQEKMRLLVTDLGQKTGRKDDMTRPVISGITNEKHGITITRNGNNHSSETSITISKYQSKPYSIIHLLQYGTLSKAEAAYLWMLADAKAIGIVVGSMGSGKTTLLRAIGSITNPRWRVLTFGRGQKLGITHKHLLEYYDAPFGSTCRLPDLIDAIPWMRPDLVIAANPKYHELNSLFHSAGAGHGILASMSWHDIESATARLGERPFPLFSGQMMPLWFAISLKQVRVQDKIAHKTKSLVEFNSTQEGVARTELFGDVAKANGTEPSKPEEIVKQSRKVAAAAEILGVDALDDLAKRIGLFDECLGNKAYEMAVACKILKKYYR